MVLNGSTQNHKHQTYHFFLQGNFTKSKVRQEMGLITVEHCCCCLATNFVGSTMGFSSRNACENVRNISWKKTETQETSVIVEQLIPLLFIPSIPFCRYPCQNFKHLHTDDPVACTASGGWHPSRASGPTILATLCNGQEPSKSAYFATCKILQIYRTCSQGHRVDVQGWKIAHEKEGTNKRYTTALLNGKQNSHPFRNTFTWSPYFPCCTIYLHELS